MSAASFAPTIARRLLDVRRHRRCHPCMRLSFVLSLILALVHSASALTPRELESIGRRVWQNECGGTREGLTAWNTGENFASLGIGHFIWYPEGVNGPFDESFPGLVKFLETNGVNVPGWLDGDCPWSTRAEFMAAMKGAKLSQLRELLADTVSLQARFLALRMEKALPKMLAAARPARREIVRENFERLAATSAGTFALIDYVNFKGEGTKDSERYHGEGWGLLQVLENMSNGPSPAAAFARSAEEVLTRRVKNSPPERGEERWLPGWRSRVRAYAS